MKRPSRADCLLLARLAEEAGRHDGLYISARFPSRDAKPFSSDVIKQIKELMCQCSSELTIDERNLLSVAYKNFTNSLRNSWRTLDALENAQILRSTATNRQLALTRDQKQRIEHELTDTCKDIINLLDLRLLPAAKQGEETVFYLKM